ncbi:MAG TPA: aspartate 1-decarboxylase [Dehalococcoidia bacterium]|nr:aspartate 1-decarboxylase [Dehalococcoidia bacterium]
MRTMLRGKIHRARVTEANPDYEGSVTIDADLMEAAGILPFEQVHILDITNGQRLQTYAIEGERGSGEVCVNGAAARLVAKDDLVIILAYGLMGDDEARRHEPQLAYVDASDGNRLIRVAHQVEPRTVFAV